MYRSPSPSAYVSPADPYGSPYPAAQPAGGTQISPGSITYTTSTGPDGRIVYHPFKAVPASYQTPSGIVSGIQWVPAEATQILPVGAQPATAEFADAWTRSSFNNEEQKALKEWQRGEEKRRRKEEKESARMLRDKQARTDEAELRLARERDAVNRERRKSFNQGSAQYTFPATTTSGSYSPNTYGGGGGYAGSNTGSVYGTSSPNLGYTRDRKYSAGGGILPDVERQFAEMGLDRNADPLVGTRPRKYSTHEMTAERTRRMSGNYGPERPLSSYAQGVAGVGGVAASSAGGYAPPARPYSRNAGSTYGGAAAYTNPSPNLRSAELSGYPSQPPMPSSPYHGPYRAPSRAPSPAHPGADPYLRSTSPMPFGDVYPPGHVMEGQPISSLGRSRPTTPSRMMGAATPGVAFPGAAPFPSTGMPSPHIGAQGQLSTPECFSRPINAAHPYTPFEAMKVMDMDGFLETIPRMPAVLQPHDVYLEDWNRLMEDIALAWSGRLPIPAPADGRTPKRASLTANLLGLWNDQFFERRGIEIVLYKGRERRSGSRMGVIDLPMPHLDDIDSLSSSSSSDSDDDDIDPRYGVNAYGAGSGGGYYGRPAYGTMDAGSEERQRRIAAKAEKKRRKKEKKMRKKVKASEKKYALYLTSIPTGGMGGIGGAPVGHAGSMVGGYGGGY